MLPGLASDRQGDPQTEREFLMTDRLMAFTRLLAGCIVLAVALAFGSTQDSQASFAASCNGPSLRGCVTDGGAEATRTCHPEDPKNPDCYNCWFRTNSSCHFPGGPHLQEYSRHFNNAW